MSCPQCQGLERLFDKKLAAKELKTYRQKGPSKTTRLLLAALKKGGVAEMTLLDIGGGIGAIQHDLLQHGVRQASHVDASAAYLEAAYSQAERLGHTAQTRQHFGNFVELAPELPPANIVTLDRVICCYHDMPALVRLSAEKAQTIYGLVYPRDTWWTKLGIRLINLVAWLQGNPCRFFVHPTEAIEAIVQASGLNRAIQQNTFFWQVAVYRRG
jgi:magnesium-protoporphyrin O-methyltransferase